MVDVDTKDLARVALLTRYWFACSPRMHSGRFTEAQWTRMRALAQSLDAMAVARFLLIQLAGLCFSCIAVGFFMILLIFMVPIGALPQPLFLLGIIVMTFVILTLMCRLLRPLWASQRTGAGLIAEPDDAELVREFTRCMNRTWLTAFGVIAVITVLLIPLFPYIRNSWIDEWFTLGSLLFAAAAFLPPLIRMFRGGRGVAPPAPTS
jgi:hypothetical protein